MPIKPLIAIFALAVAVAACKPATPQEQGRKYGEQFCDCLKKGSSPSDTEVAKCLQSWGKEIEAFDKTLKSAEERETFTKAFDETKAACVGGGKGEEAKPVMEAKPDSAKK